ncbi:MAG TPA: MOSC domain-containing protein, partial [Anaerolineae bacterium]|nr:MOSC domain-containing protein [Anaerolineae bacterium]
MIKISELYYYPIKSCAGWRVDSAELTPTGFAHDREFVVATPQGHFVTQRELPRMALIRPKIAHNQLTLTAPTMSPISLPITQQGKAQSVTVWRSTVQAIDQGDGAAQWLSQFLKAELRLFTMQAGFTRKINPAFAQAANDIVSFADGYSILVIAQASLDNLNSKLAEPLPMTRFRPNIVVTGCDPHATDRWRHITIGDIPMTGAKPCARCAVTTVDPSTG